MRIAFLGPSYPWRGGIAQFAENLAEKLAGQGHDIMMFTYIQQYPRLLFPGTGQKDEIRKCYMLSTQRIFTPYNPFTWVNAANKIKKWKPDILLISYWLPFMAPALGVIAIFNRLVKSYYLIHNAKPHEKWLLADTLTRFAFKPATGFITLSETSTSELNSLLNNSVKSRILQLYHPVYEHILSNMNLFEKNKNRILFFGFIKHYKGLDILLEAFAKVLNTLSDLILVIAGDVYGERQVYLDQINRLEIMNNVELHLRYLNTEEIEQLFLSSDLSVLPYRTATQSGVAQMSFAYEVPVIATRVGGITEVVMDSINGFLADPENPDDLAEKIILYYQSNCAKQFRMEIRRINKAKSWDNFASRLLEFLS